MLVSNFSFSKDTDDTNFKQLMFGYKRYFKNKQYLGALIGKRVYTEDKENGRNTFDLLNLVGKKVVNPYLYFEGGLIFTKGDDWNPIFYNGTVVLQKSGLGRAEFFIERSPIDTDAALEKHYIFLTYGVSLDYELTNEVTLTGAVFKQEANDGNDRIGKVAQIVYSPKWFENGYVKLRGKWREADFDPPEYFSPANYDRYNILFGYAIVFGNENWVLKLEGGPGVQYINGTEESAYDYKIALRGWITQSLGLNAYYACTSDGGTEDYSYHYGGVEIKYVW
jgi:hypothetical protein